MLEDLPDAVRRAAHGDGWPNFAAAVPTTGDSAPAHPAEALEAALRARHWNVSAAARDLGIEPHHIAHRRMRRLGIVPPHRRD